MSSNKRWLGALMIVAALLGVAATAIWLLNRQGEADIPAQAAPFKATPEQVRQGAYLARAGNCTACHTTRGGAPYAGGKGIDTPFGTVYATNLTPDVQTGIGAWSPDHFWRAMHNGRSKDGRLLYPAFPYPNYTQVTRTDSDALLGFLHSLPPVKQVNRPHGLRFPFNSQWALAAWRALFFRPGTFESEPAKSAQWNRGAYLVRGLGHCNACHAGRNVFGATSEELELSGGLIPMQTWYAPSLTSSREAGVADWDTSHVVSLLKDGVSPRGSVMGPMAEVVYRSTQYLSESDLTAMAVFLKALPQSPSESPGDVKRADNDVMARGAKLYDQHCAACHGNKGQGAPGIYPALAGNRAVTMGVSANLVRVILSGGYLPSTSGNPRPHGMPPFSPVLTDLDIAAVSSFVRGSWGNAAAPVSQLDVLQYRQGRSSH